MPAIRAFHLRRAIEIRLAMFCFTFFLAKITRNLVYVPSTMLDEWVECGLLAAGHWVLELLAGGLASSMPFAALLFQLKFAYCKMVFCFHCARWIV